MQPESHRSALVSKLFLLPDLPPTPQICRVEVRVRNRRCLKLGRRNVLAGADHEYYVKTIRPHIPTEMEEND